jgi:hypothetical protein
MVEVPAILEDECSIAVSAKRSNRIIVSQGAARCLTLSRSDFPLAPFSIDSNTQHNRADCHG